MVLFSESPAMPFCMPATDRPGETFSRYPLPATSRCDFPAPSHSGGTRHTQCKQPNTSRLRFEGAIVHMYYVFRISRHSSRNSASTRWHERSNLPACVALCSHDRNQNSFAAAFFVCRFSQPGSISTTQVKQVQQKVPIDEAKFAKPPAGP
jgi:hypothetical protein